MQFKAKRPNREAKWSNTEGNHGTLLFLGIFSIYMRPTRLNCYCIVERKKFRFPGGGRVWIKPKLKLKVSQVDQASAKNNSVNHMQGAKWALSYR